MMDQMKASQERSEEDRREYQTAGKQDSEEKESILREDYERRFLTSLNLTLNTKN